MKMKIMVAKVEIFTLEIRAQHHGR